MYAKRHRILIWALLCIGLGGAWWTPVTGQSAALVTVSPPVLELARGETARLAVTIDDAADVYGFEVELGFNPAHIQLLDGDIDAEGVQLQMGDFFGGQSAFAAVNRVDNVQGTALLAATLLAPALPKSGQGSLVTFEVQGVSEGKSTLRIESVSISSRDGVLLPVSAEYGEVVVGEKGAAPTPAPRPTPVAGQKRTLLPEGLWAVAVVLVIGLLILLFVRRATRRQRRT